MPNIGWPELVIILIVVLVLFGGSRLAGLGKASGKAIREFKEETQDLKKNDAAAAQPQITVQPSQPIAQPQQPLGQPVQPPASDPQAYAPQQASGAQPIVPPAPQTQPSYDPQQAQPSYDPQQNQQPPAQQ